MTTALAGRLQLFHQVVLADIDREKLLAVHQSIKDAGGQATIIVADVSKARHKA